jgi:3-hydroxyisobutyrate dehydrogenase
MKVGFIGLGNMGRHMAAHLQAAEHDLVVHDLRPEAAEPHLAAGAKWASSPAEVMAATEVTFTSLPKPEDVHEVALGPQGLIVSARAGKAYFDLSTNSMATIREIHQRFLAKGATVCDAPVSGGPTGARDRKLTIYAGGDESAVAAYRPVLGAFSDLVLYVGPLGAGTVAKLMHNCVGYVLNAAIAEVFTVGMKAGVQPLALWRALRNGATGRRRTFDGLADQFLPHIFDQPAFALALAHKDVSLATALGREVGVPMRLSELALADMTEALGRGWGSRDSRAAMLLQEERARVHIEVALEDLQLELADSRSDDSRRPGNRA